MEIFEFFERDQHDAAALSRLERDFSDLNNVHALINAIVKKYDNAFYMGVNVNLLDDLGLSKESSVAEVKAKLEDIFAEYSGLNISKKILVHMCVCMFGLDFTLEVLEKHYNKKGWSKVMKAANTEIHLPAVRQLMVIIISKAIRFVDRNDLYLCVSTLIRLYADLAVVMSTDIDDPDEMLKEILHLERIGNFEAANALREEDGD